MIRLLALLCVAAAAAADVYSQNARPERMFNVPVMKDDAYLDKMIALATAVRDRSKAVFALSETVEQMRTKIDLTDQQTVFEGDSRHKGFIVRNCVTLSAKAAEAHMHLTETSGAKTKAN